MDKFIIHKHIPAPGCAKASYTLGKYFICRVLIWSNKKAWSVMDEEHKQMFYKTKRKAFRFAINTQELDKLTRKRALREGGLL